MGAVDDSELGYLLAVTAACVWSPRPLTTWFEQLGSARAILEHVRVAGPLAPPGAEALSADALTRLSAIDDAAARHAVACLRSSGCSIVLKGDSAYPRRLLDLRDPPFVLYYRGDIATLAARCVAIVGSRAASAYGRRVASTVAAEFAAFGACVISGFARGVDAAAHRGALDAGSTTCAVLGSGLDNLYPNYHAELANDILEHGGTVLSEFPPAFEAKPYQFPMRNRIVAALADATIVVEASERSGALITVRLADEIGRSVFAVPGDIDRPTSAGSNALIKDGVPLVTSAADVASLMRWDLTDIGNAVASVGPGSAAMDDCVPLLAKLGAESLDADELAARMRCSAAEVAAALTVLEIQGLVERLAGGSYAAVRGARAAKSGRV